MSTTPRRSLQYLLSVDRGLRRLSLRRVRTAADPRTRRRPRRAISKTPRAAISTPAATERALTIAGIALIAIAAFAASRGMSRLPIDPETPIVETSAPEPPHTISIAGAGGSASVPVADKLHHDDIGTSGHGAPPAVRPVEGRARGAAAVRTTGNTIAPVSTRAPSAIPEHTTAVHDRSNDVSSPTVTISGCVERDRKAFWLKSVSGDDVPRTRSWRSGFFRKRASSIPLADATDGVGLEGYVGQRVTATGRFVNGELRAMSLQQLAESCSGI